MRRTADRCLFLRHSNQGCQLNRSKYEKKSVFLRSTIAAYLPISSFRPYQSIHKGTSHFHDPTSFFFSDKRTTAVLAHSGLSGKRFYHSIKGLCVFFCHVIIIIRTMAFTGTLDKCKVCDKTVHVVDMLSLEGVPYHKACFRCTHCKGMLQMSSYSSMDAVLYCKPHFEQLFKESGDFCKNFQST